MSRGKFIVLEGLDGSGKSTHIKLLAEKLESCGVPVFVTAEPSDSPVGKYIREILSNSLEKDMHLQAALFLADRIEHTTDPEFGIESCLSKGITVICDRYYYSSFAYQGTASDMNWVMDINLNCSAVIKPDICLFLDVEPKTCKMRVDCERETVELYEKSEDLMNTIRGNFLDVFEKLKNVDNICIINAQNEKHITAENIWAEVRKVMSL